jgi:hypothetical protein
MPPPPPAQFYLFNSSDRVCVTLNQLLPGDGFCFSCTGDLGEEENLLRVADPDLFEASPVILSKDIPHSQRALVWDERSTGAAMNHRQIKPSPVNPL